MTEYYAKVQAFNEKIYRDFDYIRRIQFDIRRGYQCDAKYKPTNLSDIIKLPGDKDARPRGLTIVTEAHRNALKGMGYDLLNSTKN